MSIVDWKFTTREGLVLDEYTDYPPDIKELAKDMDMADNALAYAKVTIYHEDLHDIVFCIKDIELPLQTETILTFNPFVRAICDGMSGDNAEGELLYHLEGKEYPLKKKYLSPKQDLKILQRLQRLNTD